MPRKRELHDTYFKRAKADGYVARSAYKLQQIHDRKKIIRRADRVLDLGCAPGSWLQVAAQRVGPRGIVAGLDLQPVTNPPSGFPPTVRTAIGDIFETSPEDLLALGEAQGREEGPNGEPGEAPGYDVVLSDMAPNTAGDSGDHFRSVELCRRILAILPDLLRPGGCLAMKVFEGEAYPDLLRETAAIFLDAKGFKPDASRDVSREIYIVAKGFNPTAAIQRRTRTTPKHLAPPPPPVSEGWSQ